MTLIKWMMIADKICAFSEDGRHDIAYIQTVLSDYINSVSKRQILYNITITIIRSAYSGG